MQYAYHVTLSDKLDSIKSEGLIPAIGELSSWTGEIVPRVYLFPNVEALDHALMNWLGDAIIDHYGEEVELSILEIDTSSLEIVDGEAEYEVYSYSIISPDCIVNIFSEEDISSLLDTCSANCSIAFG